MINERLTEIYEILFERFGEQNWWPGDTPFEIIIGAILTQNTSWSNVERAIANLKSNNLLSAAKLHNLERPSLAELIRPAGYFNIKAKRLKNFLNWLFDEYAGSLDNLREVCTSVLREELLGVNGIGRETADSILLYAFERPCFVVDTYTFRMALRHGLIDPDADYEQLKDLFQSNLPEEVQLFNEYHALLVRLGKEFCKTKPLCESCPLNKLPHNIESQ